MTIARKAATHWIALILLSAGAAAGAGELPPADGKPLSAILKSVEGKNLGIITSAEFDDGLWEVKTRKGNSASKLYLDPRSGEERQQKPTEADAELPPAASKPLSAIVAALEAHELGAITDVEFDDRYWEVKVRTDGRKRKFEIVTQTAVTRR